ncbi:MAG: MAPEG family protein [Hyphomonadaceae bacterium]|nr:MAPEG family protein [Hyphomonadaceae bacterium]
MTPALFWLAATLVLAIVYIMAPAFVRTQRLGTKWNAGPRDSTPDPGAVAGRLARAQANLFETLPLIIGAVLIAHLVNADAALTTLGIQLYFWARVIYLPLYGFGVPYLRSLAWVACLVGLGIVIYAVFTAPA